MTPSPLAALPVERHQVLALRWRASVRHGAVGVAVPQLLHDLAWQQAHQQPQWNQDLDPHSIPRPRARVATGTATTSEGSSRTARPALALAGGDTLGPKPDPLTTAQTAVCAPCLEAGPAVVTFSPPLQ